MFDSQFVSAVASALLHSLWIGVLVASIIAILSGARIISSPRQKYMAHFIALGSLAYFTLVAFILEYTARVGPSSFELNLIAPAQGYSAGIADEANSLPAWQNIVVLTWISGMLVFGFVQLTGLQNLARIIRFAGDAPDEWSHRLQTLCSRSGITVNVRLVSSNEADVPFVFGVIRPLIVFPANYFTQLTPREVESILVHELAHIARNDFLLNLIQIIIESILFFNPATWWLSREIRRHREYCCDDQVWSTHSRKTYLSALYKVACMSNVYGQSKVALFQNNSELIMRVKRMSQGSQPVRSLRAITMAAVGLITISGLFAFNLLDERDVISLNDFETELPERLDLNVELPPLNLREVLPLTILERQLTASVSDTHPPTPRMLELQADIERVSGEIEMLSDEMEENIEAMVEPEVERMEALAEQMEAIAEAHEERIEAEFENAPELERIEQLGEEMEARMEEYEERVEEMNEAAVEEIQRKMEAKQEEYMRYDSLPDAKRQELDREMQALTKQMEAEMQEIYKAHEKMMNDGELKAMQEEMKKLHEALAERHRNFEPMPAELAALQEELNAQQHVLNEKLSAAMDGLKEELEVRHDELRKLQEEFEVELRTWNEAHKRDE